VDLGSGGPAMTSTLRRIGRFLGPLAIAMALLFALWYLFLAVFPEVGPRVGKSPTDVWHYLFTAPTSHTARANLWDNLQITLRDAAIGFTAGIGAAIIVAAAFVLFASLEHTLLPIAVLLRSVPLVAMTPVIVLVFGRGLAGVAVMAGIVVFFPALVMVMAGLREAPRQARELVEAYGGNRWTTLYLVAIPSALPSLFAAARISVPGALIGALIGEWLGSGEGLGSSLIKAIPRYQYNELWASVAVVTIVSILLYAVVGVLESLVLARFGPDAGRTS
jgi:ABC-type nitrate/sulfonate/bicarbonate transport system permease component